MILVMNGQLVIVKDVAYRPLIRKVCYANENTVFATSEKGFKEIKKGGSDLFPIGFKAENVYCFDGHPLIGKIDWSKLRTWRSS